MYHLKRRWQSTLVFKPSILVLFENKPSLRFEHPLPLGSLQQIHHNLVQKKVATIVWSYRNIREGHRCQFVFASSVLSVMSVQSRWRILWWRWRILWRRQWISGEDKGFFTFSSSFAKNPLSSPHCLPCVHHMLQCLHCILMSEAPTLSMCGHTNEGIPSTEHVHMLHWACADIIMRGNPLTDMTENTEDANTNWQCLHTRNITSRKKSDVRPETI